MARADKTDERQERPRRAYGRPSLVKRERLAAVTAAPPSSGIVSDGVG